MIKCPHESGSDVSPDSRRDGGSRIVDGVGDDLGGSAKSAALYILRWLDTFAGCGFAISCIPANSRQDWPWGMRRGVVPLRSADRALRFYALYDGGRGSTFSVASRICSPRWSVWRLNPARGHHCVHDITLNGFAANPIVISADISS